MIAWATGTLKAAVFLSPAVIGACFFLTKRGEKLFFDVFDEFFRKFGDSSDFAFAKLVAQAKGVDRGNGLAECFDVTDKVHGLDWYAPAIDV